jgi:putative serine protease PepD
VPIDDESDDGRGFRPLPSPDDRLWRHPSELGTSGAPPRVATAPPRHRSRGVAFGLLSGCLLGAAAMLAVLASAGVLDHHGQSVAIEEVRVTTTTTSSKVASVTAKVLPALVRVDATSASGTVSGTGVVFRDDGYLLTTADTVRHATKFSVQLSSGTTVPAKLVGTDSTSDVAVLRIAMDKLKVAVLADEDDVQLGEPAFAINCVMGRPSSPDVTVGVVSALARRVSVDGMSMPDMIQTNVPTTDDGGAALVDSSGTVIGLVTSSGAHLGNVAATTTTTGSTDPNVFVARFSTPIDYARQVADELIATGKVAHPWLGIDTTDLSSAQQQALGRGGAHVDRVIASSPAQRAGLQPGDVVVAVDRTPITSATALVVQLRGDRPNQDVVVTYIRDGDQRQTTARLVNRAPGS